VQYQRRPLAQALRVDAIAKIAESEGAQLLHQLNGDTIKSVLGAAFAEADADGNGTLDRQAGGLLRTSTRPTLNRR